MWPRRKKIIVAVVTIVLAVILVGAAYGVWYAYYSPITLKAAFERMHWTAGETRDVEGTITEVRRLNTSYGPMALLHLDGYQLCDAGDILADPSRDYRVGEHFKTTLHFTEYRFNNDSGVWAPELICPVPGIFLTFAAVMDAVSQVTGVALTYGGMNQTGWTTYRIFTRDGDTFPLRALNITLMKGDPFRPSLELDSAADWNVYAADEYVRVSGGYAGHASIMDRLESLTSGASENGTIRFLDKTSDGYLGSGDEISVRLPPTLGDRDYQTYMLCFGNCMALGYTGGVKYIVNGNKGPHDWAMVTEDSPPVVLRHVSDQIGLNVTSFVEVSGGGSALTTPPANYSFSFRVGDGTDKPARPVNETPTRFPDGTIVYYQDSNSNSLLDAGDRFVISGLANRTYVHFTLSLNRGGEISTDWITGYGHVVGNLPDMLLTPTAQNPYRINISVPWWHQELAIGKTLTVSLWENSARVLDNSTLADGMVATFPGGDLTWTDNDHDGFVSTGDFFTLNGNAAARYRIELSALFGFRSYSTGFGP